MTDEIRALFSLDGDGYVPTDFARGPWNPENLHGGPVAALLAREAQRCGTDGAMEVARLTVELLRPVTMHPLSLEVRVARPGRKVQLVDVTARQDGRDVAQARMLRIRTEELALPESVPEERCTFSGPEDVPAPRLGPRPRSFHTEGAELRFLEGSFGRPGPAVVWIRLRHPVVAGEEPSPLERVVAALPFGAWQFINPDLTVHLNRPAIGPWVAVEARMYPQPNGIAFAESRLWDVGGPIGRAVQSLLVERLS